jgi:hypothetical protein
MASLLAVDLGLRTGLACFRDDGRLRWYRSHNIGTTTRLRKAAPAVLAEIDDLALLVLEGGGTLADIWDRAAARRGIEVRRVTAEVWRKRLLLPSEQRSGREAKRSASDAARRVIAWSDAPRPRSLRHDAAEAILVGLWGALEAGWLRESPL